ncbi:MAG: class A beta-lactamase-related serine hydrolase [Verrucomicrobiaceae bacterium]|nr:MAG: class A beta-lactamase-related serine hydrolase [Verrucomicrobiaceae bacterium]
MRKNPCFFIFCAGAVLAPLHAAPEQTAVAGAAFPAFPAVKKTMGDFIAAKELAGSVTVVADGSKVLHLSADGMANIAEKRPMAPDSIFWIASMTKPVTATAVMMMHEEGLLSVDDPVAKYLPEFRNLKDAAGKDVTVTIAQCLIHSSGLAELSPEEARSISNLEELMPVVAAKPVQFEPGSKWQYCQSSINTAARIVEVVSGKTFPAFLEQRLFKPLGMKDTTFYPTEEQAKRLAASYKRTDSGELEEAPLFFLNGDLPSLKNRYPMANGGLFSTGGDYVKFAQMILNGGELNGKRYLKEESVKLMTGVRSGNLSPGFTPGNAWGLGWCIAKEPQGVTEALSPGSFGHGGLFGTQAWIDPVKKRIYLLLIQRANFSNQGGSDGSEFRRQFQNAAAKS